MACGVDLEACGVDGCACGVDDATRDVGAMVGGFAMRASGVVDRHTCG